MKINIIEQAVRESDKLIMITDSQKIAHQRQSRDTLKHSGNQTEGSIMMTKDSYGGMYIKELLKFTQQ